MTRGRPPAQHLRHPCHEPGCLQPSRRKWCLPGERQRCQAVQARWRTVGAWTGPSLSRARPLLPQLLVLPSQHDLGLWLDREEALALLDLRAAAEHAPNSDHSPTPWVLLCMKTSPSSCFPPHLDCGQTSCGQTSCGYWTQAHGVADYLMPQIGFAMPRLPLPSSSPVKYLILADVRPSRLAAAQAPVTYPASPSFALPYQGSWRWPVPFAPRKKLGVVQAPREGVP